MTKTIYKTWQECATSSIRLGAKCGRSYRRVYKGDPMLPSNPEARYPDFPGYDIFFNRVQMSTDEASVVAKSLGIKRKEDYARRYKEGGPKMPSASSVQTRQDFPGWPAFLGTVSSDIQYPNEGGKARQYHKDGVTVMLYPVWQEASAAAIALGVTYKSAYERAREIDWRLPKLPHVTYPDFPGWDVFLGCDVAATSRAVRSANTKAFWEDDEKRANTTAKFQKRSADPKYRKKLSVAALKRWSDPDYRDRQIAKILKSLTPERRAKALDGLMRWCKDPSLSEVRSRKVKDCWRDPEWQKAQADGRASFMSDPERVRAKSERVSSAVKRAWATDPTYGERIGTAAKERWSDAEYASMMRTALSRAWAASPKRMTKSIRNFFKMLDAVSTLTNHNKKG